MSIQCFGLLAGKKFVEFRVDGPPPQQGSAILLDDKKYIVTSVELSAVQYAVDAEEIPLCLVDCYILHCSRVVSKKRKVAK